MYLGGDFIKIDVVVGFFQSGKTTFIKKYIENEVLKVYDNVLVINCEISNNKYNVYDGIFIENIYDKDKFTEGYINELLIKYKCDYVIIEYNGMWDISSLLSMKFVENIEIKNLFNIIDYSNFEKYIINMKSLMLDKIVNADVTILTKSNLDKYRSILEYSNDDSDKLDGSNKFFSDSMTDKKILLSNVNKGFDRPKDFDYLADKSIATEKFSKFKKVCSSISKINPATSIYIIEDLFDKSNKKTDFVGKKITNSDFELIKFFIIVGLFFSVVIASIVSFSRGNVSNLVRFFQIFISLVTQILPFILIGSLLSGVIQTFVPQKKLYRVFEKTSIKSIFLSLFVGIAFPVCDCAMVPIANSIAKKGYSIPAIITFLLAAPALNPVVIISTYYAFPQNTTLVLYRILFGLLIAFLIGILLMISERLEYKNKDYKSSVLKNDLYSISHYDYNDDIKPDNLTKFEAVIIHCKNEFFKTLPYIIFGAFVSTVIQIIISKDIFIQLNSINVFSVIAMILASIFISVCSTSNAFIARTFSNIMPLNSILAFMVAGPLIEITNLSVLSSTFKKKFVISLVFKVIYISFIIFSLMRGGISLV